MPIGLRVNVDDSDVRKTAFEALRKTGDLRIPLLRTMMFMRREAGGRLKARQSEDSTGQLRASLAVGADKTSGWLGSNKIYAAIQHWGGIVLPKTVKRLAIPLLPHLRRRGIWPRDWNEEADGKLFPYKAEGSGKLFLARHKKRGGAIELVYWLVAKVKIKGRPYIIFDGRAREFLLDQLRRWMGRK
jgi:hypothetical protein